MNRSLWLADDDGTITAYQLQRGPSVTGPWTTIATVVNDKTGPQYLSGTSQFFFDDAAGLDTDYYQVRAVAGVEASPYSARRQADPPLEPRCRVWGRLLNLDSTPIEPPDGVEIIFTIKSTQRTKSGQIVGAIGVGEEQLAVFADADGDWEADLLQGAEVVIDIPAANLTKTFVVPATDEAEFTTLI